MQTHEEASTVFLSGASSGRALCANQTTTTTDQTRRHDASSHHHRAATPLPPPRGLLRRAQDLVRGGDEPSARRAVAGGRGRREEGEEPGRREVPGGGGGGGRRAGAGRRAAPPGGGGERGGREVRLAGGVVPAVSVQGGARRRGAPAHRLRPPARALPRRRRRAPLPRGPMPAQVSQAVGRAARRRQAGVPLPWLAVRRAGQVRQDPTAARGRQDPAERVRAQLRGAGLAGGGVGVDVAGDAAGRQEAAVVRAVRAGGVHGPVDGARAALRPLHPAGEPHGPGARAHLARPHRLDGEAGGRAAAGLRGRGAHRPGLRRPLVARARAAPPQPAPVRGALRAHQHARVRGQGRQGAVLLGAVPVPAGGAGPVDAAGPVRVDGEVAAAEGAAELVLPPERVQGVRAGHGVPVVAERGAAPGEGAHQGALPQPPVVGHLGRRVPAVDGQGRPRHALLLRPQHHLAAARAGRGGAGAGGGRRGHLRVVPGQGRLRHAARAQPDQQVLPARRALQGVQGQRQQVHRPEEGLRRARRRGCRRGRLGGDEAVEGRLAGRRRRARSGVVCVRLRGFFDHNQLH
ncbi:hypothetical protein ACQJBY_056083 [Aegilops geniculata]